MPGLEYYIPIAAAFLGGMMNAIAGGGSFFTFPALVYAGVPALNANASSSIVLFPSVLASAWAYRHELQEFGGVRVRSMWFVSILGGASGALLLLSTREETFDLIIPWLLLVSTIVFAFGRRWAPLATQAGRHHRVALLLAQFMVAVYGGYFGGAVGLVMLAVWSLFGATDIRAMTAGRTLFGGSLNAAAVVLFIAAGAIWWTEALPMMFAAMAGGYFGAKLFLRMNPVIARAIVIAVSVGVTAAFFMRS